MDLNAERAELVAELPVPKQTYDVMFYPWVRE
jgi:hypothetical protein